VGNVFLFSMVFAHGLRSKFSSCPSTVKAYS
jgi:hypothetical protein